MSCWIDKRRNGWVARWYEDGKKKSPSSRAVAARPMDDRAVARPTPVRGDLLRPLVRRSIAWAQPTA
jgi:hypothetical protein